MRAEARLSYVGPAFLQNIIERRWPNQNTIFHRVVTYDLNSTTDFNKVALLKNLRSLKRIRFYSYDNMDGIEIFKVHFPNWKLDQIGKSRYLASKP